MPIRRFSSAYFRASIIDVSGGKVSRSLSLGIITIVSTLLLSSAIPLTAFSSRRLPSNANGFVTTATVTQPHSLAIFATTGAAPVPVPPPMPAAMNSKSTPCKRSFILSLLSSAAFMPTSGLAPAPRPFVSFSPIAILFSSLTFDNIRACLSVFTEINSAEVTPASIILLTALFPAPPMPATIILHTFKLFNPVSIFRSSLFSFKQPEKSPLFVFLFLFDERIIQFAQLGSLLGLAV